MLEAAAQSRLSVLEMERAREINATTCSPPPPPFAFPSSSAPGFDGRFDRHFGEKSSDSWQVGLRASELIADCAAGLRFEAQIRGRTLAQWSHRAN